jgi:hypothetical protein
MVIKVYTPRRAVFSTQLSFWPGFGFEKPARFRLDEF